MALLLFELTVFVLLFYLLQFLHELRFTEFDGIIFHRKLGLSRPSNRLRFLSFGTFDLSLFYVISHEATFEHVTNFAKVG